MSTRANVVVRDGNDSLVFYRHSDGYPTGVQESLEKLISALNKGQIRKNTLQCAGWLIVIGAEEYGSSTENLGEDDFSSWKVGAYEPTMGIHGDIDFLYVVDLESDIVNCHVLRRNFEEWERSYKAMPLLEEAIERGW